jgi:hypothetical protein
MTALRLALCGLLLLALPVAAQEPPRLYQVELIVFRHADAVALEAWPSASRTRVPRNARALPVTEEGSLPPENFHRAEPRVLRLSRSVQRMAGMAEVEPLLHLGWRQSHALLRAGRRVSLDGEVAGFGGFIALRLGNRLVAEVDVTLDAAVAPAYPAPQPGPTDEPNGEEAMPAPPPAEGFRLHQRRTLRLGENHYFDHPAFGLILRVDRVDPETP